jgi:hypothetical protein
MNTTIRSIEDAVGLEGAQLRRVSSDPDMNGMIFILMEVKLGPSGYIIVQNSQDGRQTFGARLFSTSEYFEVLPE